MKGSKTKHIQHARFEAVSDVVDSLSHLGCDPVSLSEEFNHLPLKLKALQSFET
jgi:hypothetical protein